MRTTDKPQCPYVTDYDGGPGAGGGTYNCAREAGHAGRHLDSYDGEEGAGLKRRWYIHEETTLRARLAAEAELARYRNLCARETCEHSEADHSNGPCGVGVEIDEGWARCGCEGFVAPERSERGVTD
jgi:hypothetical protein